MSAKMIDVLVVDDEDDIREVLELSFLRMGLSCDTAASIAQAHRLLEENSFRLCLTDMRLTDGDGLDLVSYIQAHHPALPVAVMTAYGSIETAIKALKSGAFDFVTKPVELKVLKTLVQHALKLDGSSSPEHGESEGSLIGKSKTIANLRTQISKLARNQAPVFIQGESGTGKEVIARMIHAQGPRADAPFVPVNCGALPPDLMESEFFGHKKGSFTGATLDKDGLFQAANGGTLFLDEVADLPLTMQVKLLRAIQERAIRPIGGYKEEKVDVRILSASHRDLGKMVAEGKFRQDLFFRINVIMLHIPPLRERIEDIDGLAGHILVRLAEREGGAVKRLSAEALEELQHYAFPGNVRELENILERACALAESDILQPDDLNLPSSGMIESSIVTTAVNLPTLSYASTFSVRNDEEASEQAQILKVLDETRWNRTEAARRLGMTLRQLRYRLQKWGME